MAIEDLGAESFIAHNVPSPLRRQVVAAFEKHKTPLNMGVELPSLEAVKRFVAMGNGVRSGSRIDGGSGTGQWRTGPGAGGSAAFRTPSSPGAPQATQTCRTRRLAFLKVVRSLSLERGLPYEFRVEGAG